MLRDVAIARIQRGLGFRTDQTDNIILALQEAQRLLERGRTLPYFLLQQAATLSSLGGVQSISLPAGFLREGGIKPFIPDPITNRPLFLEKMEVNKAIATFQGDDESQPKAYCLRLASILLFPVPDIVYTIFWDYYKAADTLSTNIENAWLEEEFGAPEVLIGKAGAAIAADLGNVAAAERFNRMYLEAWAGMFADTVEREEENLNEAVGERL